jgi:hypothetical protein
MVAMHNPLMAVQFPHDFAVADLIGVQRVERAPMRERRRLVRHQVAVPVDRIAERQHAIAKEIQTPCHERVGRDRHNVLAVIRHPALERLECMRFREAGKKSVRSGSP